MIWQPFIFLARDSSCGTTNGLLPGLYDNLCSGGNVKIEGLGDIFIIVANVVRILTALAGGIAVIAIIGAGIYYVISVGQPAKISRAKEIITEAVIGLLLVIAAYAIVTFIGNSF